MKREEYTECPKKESIETLEILQKETNTSKYFKFLQIAFIKNSAKTVKSDNFSRSNRAKTNIAIAILEND